MRCAKCYSPQNTRGPIMHPYIRAETSTRPTSCCRPMATPLVLARPARLCVNPQVLAQLNAHAASDTALSLLRPLHQRGQRETKKQRLKRELQMQRAGLVLPGAEGAAGAGSELLRPRRVRGVGGGDGEDGSGSGEEDEEDGGSSAEEQQEEVKGGVGKVGRERCEGSQERVPKFRGAPYAINARQPPPPCPSPPSSAWPLFRYCDEALTCARAPRYGPYAPGPGDSPGGSFTGQRLWRRLG